MNIIATADTHFTDLPADEHRWGLFPWLAQQASRHGAGMIVLAGDVTQNKNNHSAKLTNRLVANLRLLAAQCPVWVLRGNHDYIDENEPFFGFVDKFKHINFITKPTPVTEEGADGRHIFLLPNTRNYQEAWKDLRFNDYALIFCHQTFDGSKSETGFELTGIPPSVFFKTKAQVYSGDVHVPQKVSKNITSIGAPYRVRYGDTFDPRVLLIRDDGSTKDLHFPTKNKLTVDLLGGKNVGPTPLADHFDGQKSAPFNINVGDQVKVRVHMPRSAYPEWPDLRRKIISEAQEMGLELAGPELVAIPEAPAKGKKAPSGANKAPQAATPMEVLAAYAEREALPGAITKAGEKLLRSVLSGK